MSATDLFVVGMDTGTNLGVILHFNGTLWSRMFDGDSFGFSRVWGTSSSNVFAVGGINVWHFDGSHGRL